jgi:hypothetical protein
MKPKVGLTAPHDLADLKEAVELVLQDTSVAITSSIYAAPSIAQTKQEPVLTAFMTKLVEVLAMNGQNSNQLYPPRNLPPRPDDCNYSSATVRTILANAKPILQIFILDFVNETSTERLCFHLELLFPIMSRAVTFASASRNITA